MEVFRTLNRKCLYSFEQCIILFRLINLAWVPSWHMVSMFVNGFLPYKKPICQTTDNIPAWHPSQIYSPAARGQKVEVEYVHTFAVS